TFTQAGSPTVTATYNPQGAFAGSSDSQSVSVHNKASSSTALTDFNTSSSTVYGQQAQILVTVTSAIAGGPIPTGTVHFLSSLNGGAFSLFADARSQTVFSLGGGGQLFMPMPSTTAVGSYAIVASYSGDANFLASSSTVVSHTVSKSQTTVPIVLT